MPITDNLAILQHLDTQLKTITTDNGYSTTVQYVDREYRERAADQYPFLFINDVDDKYIHRIAKDLHQKLLIVQIAGFIFDDRHGVNLPQLGTKLQEFKADLLKCLAADTYFNESDLVLNIMEIVTEGTYLPPQAGYLCHIAIQYYSNQ